MPAESTLGGLRTSERIMHLPLAMPRQPTDSSCGPTCLHAVYRYFDVESDLERLISEVPQLDEGGTLAVHLGLHAVRRGFAAKIISYNLRVFDPTWRDLGREALIAKLQLRIPTLTVEKARGSHLAYIEYLRLGGEVGFMDLTPESLAGLLKHQVPLITGLSATYLYQAPREQPDGREDDIGGQPVGHFVVVNGWNAGTGEVLIADPFERNPFNPDGTYRVDVNRFISAVMLGIVSYDANFLLIRPRTPRVALR